MAHRDLASRIHACNAAESGQTRTDANDRKAKFNTSSDPACRLASFHAYGSYDASGDGLEASLRFS
jgi:hypothetical protein